MRVTIGAYPADPRICTVANLRAYLRRFPQPDDYKHLDTVRPAFIPLFTYRPRKGEPTRALGSQRIAKRAKELLSRTLAADDFRWTAHQFRAAASSKCANLGAEIFRVTQRARWKCVDTFAKAYYQPNTYSNAPRDARALSLETLLRFNGKRLR